MPINHWTTSIHLFTDNLQTATVRLIENKNRSEKCGYSNLFKYVFATFCHHHYHYHQHNHRRRHRRRMYVAYLDQVCRSLSHRVSDIGRVGSGRVTGRSLRSGFKPVSPFHSCSTVVVIFLTNLWATQFSCHYYITFR